MLNIANKNLPKIYSSFETSKIEEEFIDSYYNNLCIIDTHTDSNFLAPEGITGLKVNAIEAYSKDDLPSAPYTTSRLIDFLVG